MKIAVTGGAGFIGRALVEHLRAIGHEPVVLNRADLAAPAPKLSDVEALIHCAGLAHRDGRNSPTAEEFDEVNHFMAARLARVAAALGLRRFVFVSSISVVAGNPGPLRTGMPHAPIGDYGLSKAAAERSLLAVEDIEIVIIRPPLVYGPGAPGNLRALMRLCHSGLPVPFGMVENARSMVSRTNLVEALAHLATTDRSVDRQIFHIGDPPISTRELVRRARAAMRKPARLVPVPPIVLRAVLSLAGRARMADQLLGDLLVDSDALLEIGWRPRILTGEDIEAMAIAYKNQSRSGA
jgi:UDP-glucose 4-epimerase